MAKRQLTEMQQKFLDSLFDEDVMGDLAKAAKKAGYTSIDSAVFKLIRSLRTEILEVTEEYLAVHAPMAAIGMVSGITDPSQLGLKDKMNAAKEVMDRAGVIKKDGMGNMGDAAKGVLFIMPAKDVQTEEDE